MSESGTRRMSRAVWVAAVLAVVALVAWRASAWSGPSQMRKSDTDATGYSSDPGLTVYKVGDRVAVPDLQGTTLDGQSLELSDLSGHVVVLNVWGSWCGPCRAEAPTLARLSSETAGRGVRFVGIDTRDRNSAAVAFERSFHITYPSLVDTSGELMVQFNGLIPLTGVPSTLVLDLDGHVAARVVGKVTYPTLRGLIEDELSNNQGIGGGS